MSKPLIPVTLVAVDTGDKPHLAARSIAQCLKLADFAAVKLLTHDASLPYAVKIDRFEGVEGYSKFVVRDLHRFIDTSHCLVVQWDGFAINARAWSSQFLRFDYIGAAQGHWVGLGGFSLRSKALLTIGAAHNPHENPHPEDSWLSLTHRRTLAERGLKFGTPEAARAFACESREWNPRTRIWNGTNRGWGGEFGFHSYLTRLPPGVERPTIFHHSGDLGDIIYALPTIKALGGGVLYVSPENRVLRTRVNPTPVSVANLASLLKYAPYIWAVHYVERTPYSVDYNLNEFRRVYLEHRAVSGMSLARIHSDTFGVDWDETQPWLAVPPVQIAQPIVINRTARYHNDAFPWRELVGQFAKHLAFVGTPEEHNEFTRAFGMVTYHPTPRLESLGQVISGARLFIGNQSCPMAIALALGKDLIQEVNVTAPDCLLRRDNALYIRCAGGRNQVAERCAKVVA